MATAISRDGTSIGYEKTGVGPLLVLVDGALGYRAFGSMQALAKLLAPAFTVITYDRRGRGKSGDTPPYALQREVEDMESLLAAGGAKVSLFGTSSGACLALEAAVALGERIEKLAMYEPPYNSDDGAREAWWQYGRRLMDLLDSGRRADAVVLFMTFVGTPPEMVERIQHSPVWPLLEAVAPTLVYDRAAIGEDRKVPTELAARLRASALVMNGSLTVPFIADAAERLAEAMPDARHMTLKGQRHDFDPQVLAPILIEFLSQTPSRL